MINDISLSALLNTLIISIVITAVGWGLKETAVKLINVLVSTIASAQLLDAKLGKLIHAVGDIESLKLDLGAYLKRLKILEDKFENHKHD